MKAGPAIAMLHPADLAAFETVIGEDSFLPCAYLPGAPAEGVRAMQRCRIEELCANPDCTVFGLAADGVPAAMASIEPLAWDSATLGIAVGRVGALHARAGIEARAQKTMLLRACAEAARERGWQCMDLQTHLSDLDAANAAASCGFDLAATNIAIVWDLSQPVPDTASSEAIVRLATPNDVDDLESLARRSVDPYSRFAADARLPRDAAQTIFAAWAANSARGYADLVHVARVDGRACGYCTWRVHKPAEEHLGFKFVRLDLTAVAEEARGKHVLTALARAGLAHWQAAGFRFAEVNTHALNGGMQRACGGLLGGRTLAARHTWHWHAGSAL